MLKKEKRLQSYKSARAPTRNFAIETSTWMMPVYKGCRRRSPVEVGTSISAGGVCRKDGLQWSRD